MCRLPKVESQFKNLILGAGPAGIATAIGLEKDYCVLERSNQIGGASQTIEIEGAVLDYGGHSFHTPHPEIKELVFSAVEMYEQKREAYCFHDGQIIPYPFQKSFKELKNEKIVSACQAGLEGTSSGSGAANYEEFILQRFGKGIAEEFMLPYNRKLWGRDLKRLSASWVSERVAAPEGVREKFDESGGKRKPLQSDTKVAYPAKGGFGQIFSAVGKKIKNVRLETNIESISARKQSLQTRNGETFKFDRLISTIALPDLLGLIEETPQEIFSLVKRLEYLSLSVVFVVLDHPVNTPIQRIYSAESKIAAHKTAINHNSSPYLRSLPRNGIMAEVSVSDEKPLARKDLEEWVVENLAEMNIIKSKSAIVKTTTAELKYAYPVPTLDRIAILQAIKDWLWTHNIHTMGRFGDWDYINSDEVLHRGIELGRALRA